jgi:hypothetical protein
MLQTTHNGQGGGKPTIIGQRGLKNKKRDYYYYVATLPCLVDKWGKTKINLKDKTKLAQRYWGVGLANHTPKV